MKKKILVLTNMYPSQKDKTFGIFVANQVDALRQHGYLVDVLAIRNPQGGYWQSSLKYGRWLLKTFINFIWKGKHYDVVHAHYAFPSGMLAWMYKKAFKTKMIVTVHGGDLDKMIRIHPFIYKWTKKVLQEADAVIAVGEELYNRVSHEFGAKQKNVYRLSMGVDERIFYPMKETGNLPATIKGKHIILFVGNIVKQKGIDELINAFSIVEKEMEDIILIFIGPIRDDSFLRKIKEKKRILYIGALQQREICIWMNRATVFVLPSHLEGFGLVALEAMACGTPVIGTEVGGLKYLLKDGHGILVQPYDVTELAEAIIKLVKDPSKQKELIKKGQKRAKEHSVEKVLSTLEELYTKEGV
ncbi:MAG: glycosyltransferase [Bacillaceae bacterium]